jgi:hypothetical protein
MAATLPAMKINRAEKSSRRHISRQFWPVGWAVVLFAMMDDEQLKIRAEMAALAARARS